MRISVGIDIAKEVHWVTALDADGAVHIDRKLPNTPAEIAALIDELAALGGTVRAGLDVVGGIAGLIAAMLAEAGFALVHVPGLAVNRARQGTVGGENKSDPRDARTIADQVRTRSDLRPIEPLSELDVEIRLLVARRRDLVQAQTQRLSRLHDLLVSIFPGLERLLDLDRELEASLERHPDAALIRSLPGMGAILTAELIAEAGNLSRFRSADALASAAGMAPVLRQSGRTRFLRRPSGGNKGLKRVFYQSAFCSLGHDDSRAFYARKRREGKRHHQAVIALARRRVNVLWAVVRSRTPFQTSFKISA
jgi:transposase